MVGRELNGWERWQNVGAGTAAYAGSWTPVAGLLRPRPPVGINNPIPGTFARVVPEGTPLETLGKPGRSMCSSRIRLPFAE